MIHLVLALEVEAEAVIDRFELTRHPVAGRMRLWVGDEMRLVVGGMGRTAAAAAAGYLGGVRGAAGAATWINYGIGGHPDRVIGDVVLAERIIEPATGRQWPLRSSFAAPCAVATVCTVDRIEHDYPQPYVYEMEASGFYVAARRFEDSSRIHVLKVVSDNRLAPAVELSLERAGELAAVGLPMLEKLVRVCRRSP